LILGSAKKILIIRLSSLGDILLTTPLIRYIKHKNPDTEIDFVLRENYEDLLKLNQNVRKIYKYNEAGYIIQDITNSIISEEYDLIIDLQNNFRSRGITGIAKAPVVKFNKRDLDKFLFVKFKLNRLKDLPPVPVRYSKTIEDLELDSEGLDLITDKIPDERLQSGSNWVGLCPGAKHFTKRWPIENYISLAKLLNENGFNVVLFGGTMDSETCSQIAKETGTLNLCNENDILQTAADMRLCKTIYTNDSGLMHVATAVKVPVVAIFGSTVKEFGFFPYNAKSIVIENKNLSCRPCTHIGRASCPKKHFRCMKEITPKIAFEKLNELKIN
jgi:lipopolysaccharide heptosyltransferase II